MEKQIVYLDLFSGLGSFAKGLLSAGFVFKKHYFSEIDNHCIASYRYNFKNANYVGDIEKFETQKIERPDIVTFGSPCQDLSLAGKRAGIKGRKSNLFFRAIEIIKRFRPRVFVFENVSGLFSSNKGKDFEIVLETIAELGLYECQWQLINTSWFLPQNRERIYLVGCLRDEPRGAVFPLNVPYEKETPYVPKVAIVGAVTNSGSQTAQIFKGSRFSPTLMVASGYANGYLEVGKRVRRLTLLEGERLQGLPDNWTQFGIYDGEKKVIADTHRYEMIGNAVSRPIVTEIGKALLSGFNPSLNGTSEKPHSNLSIMERELENHLINQPQLNNPKSTVMITLKNYFKEIAKVTVSKLPQDLQMGHRAMGRYTKNGTDWDIYETEPKAKAYLDEYIILLNEYLAKKTSTNRVVSRSKTAKKAALTRKRTTAARTTPRPIAKKKPVAKKRPVVKKDIVIGRTRSGKNIYEFYKNPKHKNFTAKDHEDAENAQLTSNKSTLSVARRDEQGALHAKKRNQMLTQAQKAMEQKKTKARALKARKASRLKRQTYHFGGEHVERISEELKFIKRFVLMHGKSKTPQQIRLFINALQKAMTEKRIRKTSKYASEILEIQDALLNLYTKLKGRKAIKVEIGEERRSHFLTITGKQRLLPSVRIIKSYISLQGRVVQVTAAKSLLARIDKALLTKAVPLRDPYAKQISEITQSLRNFIAKTKVEGVLLIPSRELSGLNGIVDELEGLSFNSEFDGFNGFGSIPDDAIVNTMDIVNMQFPTIGFTGKWLRFVGDPNKGFTAMVFGLPKYGKSYLCVDWAGYLARNHGRVLYVAKEEKIGGTLQEKLRETRMAHPNFDSTGALPIDFSGYDFVFLDSVTKLGLSPEDLDDLKAEYPGVSFIYIFQTTKQGAFRGSNGFQHDVDIVIEVPEPGKAIQYGRYNQRSEMDITF